MQLANEAWGATTLLELLVYNYINKASPIKGNNKLWRYPQLHSSLMPCLTTWAHSCSAVVLPVWTMSSPKGVQKQSHGWSCQGCKAANHTGTLLNLPKHWNSPELSGTCLRNLYQHTPEPSGTFRNLTPEPAPATRTGTHRSLSGLKTPLAYAVGEKLKKRV